RQLFGGGFLHEINLDSPTQVQKAFAQRGVSLRSTSRWALAEYSEREDVRLFQEYRKASKLCSSFLDVLPQAIHPRTGRLHPTYEQCGVVSGRFSCHSPNLQQLPREKEFRACFVPEAGNCLVIADYSQIELRVAAELSQDRRMMAAYQQKQDLHTLTASLITQKNLEQVTKADRQASKAVNFGLLYGQGARGLKSYSKQSYGVDMTLEEAALFRERFFQAYRGISNWQRKTARESKRLTETRTFWGRRWLLEGHQPDLPTLLNMPVQGTAADITKLALAKLVPALTDTGARIIGCIHDEILLEAPLETAPQAASILTEMMETAGREVLKEVPVEAESRICRNWAEK
ncbi:MAG: bifunctional 3'-5' exonuclease/DNA polymerase, partial [Blastocatellia bacterium]|nr:bifunctional 3'-5' exonuclease/DNA polymerase [Blastocatellia bacterium]